MNFDKQLLALFTEVHYWERLHFEIPYAAMVRQCRLTL